MSEYMQSIQNKQLATWRSGKESACQCRRLRRLGFSPWVWEDALEEGMTTYFSILAWEIPWTKEPSRLQSMGSQRDTTERLSTHSIQQSFTAFNDWIIVHCGYAVSTIQSSVDGRLDCFHILAGINDATVNIQAHVFVQMSCSHFSWL